MPRIVDAFPHVLPRACLERFLAAASGEGLAFLRGIQGRPQLAPLWDLDARFRAMDEVQADYVQLLTLVAPPIEQMASGQRAVDLARLANDQMAELVSRHPDRFKGFAASLPMEDVDASVAEVERTTRDLGALGVQVFTNVNGRCPDEPRFEPLWATLAALKRAVWVHGARRPTTPDYDAEERSRLGLWASLGWPYEMGLLAARLVVSGLLDRHPDLPFYLHHSGGMTATFGRRVGPSWLQLQSPAPEDEAVYARLQRPVFDYFRLYYADTSGQTPIAIEAALKFFGADHVLLGSDTPFTTPAAHVQTVSQLPLTEAERAQVLGGNAERLLGLAEGLVST